MNFKSYHSIEPLKRSKDDYGSEVFCVLEKVHGANLQMISDGKDVLLGKRSSFLTPDEHITFYNAGQVLDKYKSKVLDMFNFLKDIKTLIIYGELFGGQYPGTKNISKPVQKGIWYSQNVDFYAFDIYVDDRLIAYDEAISLFKKFDFFYAIPEFIGSFSECVKHSSQTRNALTDIPKHFNLSSIDKNFREGNIIKPIKPLYDMRTRIIFKDKNKIYEEKSKPLKIVRKETSFTNSEIELLEEALSYVVEERYNSTVSKIGQENPHKIAGLLTSDALKDFYLDNQNRVFTNREKNILKSEVARKSKELVMEISN